MDIMQTAHMLNFDTTVTGVTALPNDPEGYAPTAGSDVIVVTSGMPRKPGMSVKTSLVSTPRSLRALSTRLSNILRTLTSSSFPTRWMP